MLLDPKKLKAIFSFYLTTKLNEKHWENLGKQKYPPSDTNQAKILDKIFSFYADALTLNDSKMKNRKKIPKLRDLCDSLPSKIAEATSQHKSAWVMGLAGLFTNYPALADTLSGVRSYLLDCLYDAEADIPSPLVSLKSQIRDAELAGDADKKAALIAEYNTAKESEIADKIVELKAKIAELKKQGVKGKEIGDATSRLNELNEIAFYKTQTGARFFGAIGFVDFLAYEDKHYCQGKFQFKSFDDFLTKMEGATESLALFDRLNSMYKMATRFPTLDKNSLFKPDPVLAKIDPDFKANFTETDPVLASIGDDVFEPARMTK